MLESNLPVMENEDALMERGGVFALMGPTGVGKTTTTAKLAARCVMRFGASKVALLTTDSYRIGGHEQLRIFGKILGVSVHAVKDGADLQLALSELRNKHIVLIDTIGMSQRDRLVSDQIAMLCRAGQPVQRLLLLNATSHGDTLNEVVQAYQRAPDQQPLAGCILTKLDEATNLGGVLDTVIRYKLPVHYVSTGQKVPENLYVATKKFLIKSAFCIPRDSSPFVPHDDDIPGLAVGAVRALDGRTARGSLWIKSSPIRQKDCGVCWRAAARACVAVTGGSTGVGCTTTVVNLAAALAEQGKDVLVIDECLGDNSVSAMLGGVRGAGNFAAVMRGEMPLEDAVARHALGFSVLAASREQSRRLHAPRSCSVVLRRSRRHRADRCATRPARPALARSRCRRTT